MAARRRKPAEPVPVYSEVGGAVVPLSYPFRYDGKRYTAVRLLPPTLDDLEALRRLDGLGAADILAPMTGIMPGILRLFRWPDIEAALRVALDLLPPDLRARLDGGDEPEPEAEAAAVPPSPPDASDDEPGSMQDFLIGDGGFDHG